MKIKITWKDGSKDKFSASLDEESLAILRRGLFEKFSTTIISVGDPMHTFYCLKDARKVEIYE